MFAVKPELAGEIRRLAAERAQPFYLYERTEIYRVARRFLELPWAEKSIHFATMANDSRPFLGVVREAGLSVFVNSVDHLERVRALGFAGREIVFTASAMDERTMRAAHEQGAVLNLDSLGQVAAFRALYPDGRAGLRCNIGDKVTPRPTRAGYFIGRNSRLGLTLEELDGLRGADWVEGLHLYAGTDILELDHFEECYLHLAELVPLFPRLRYLDFGGGFGVPRASGGEFDFGRYGALLGRVMARASELAGRTLHLILEPGRILGAEAGHFVCRVVDVKRRGDRQLVGVNASSAQFPRPLFYPDDAYHPVAVLPADLRDTNASRVQTDVFGCSTYSRDYLALDADLPATRPGDLLVLGHAGAYCASAHTSFLGFPRAEELLT